MDWKINYVANAENQAEDQVLEEVSVGPPVTGIHKFVFQAPGPRSDLIRNQDLIGVTAVLITCKSVLPHTHLHCI